MKRFCLLLALFAFASGTPPTGTTAAQDACPRPHWVGAYVPGWAQEDSAQFQDYEFDLITHLLHFAVFVRPNGSLDLRSNELTPNNMRDLIAQGHHSGRKVLLVVGGERADKGLRIACSTNGEREPLHDSRFIVVIFWTSAISLEKSRSPSNSAARLCADFWLCSIAGERPSPPRHVDCQRSSLLWGGCAAKEGEPN